MRNVKSSIVVSMNCTLQSVDGENIIGLRSLIHLKKNMHVFTIFTLRVEHKRLSLIDFNCHMFIAGIKFNPLYKNTYLFILTVLIS